MMDRRAFLTGMVSVAGVSAARAWDMPVFVKAAGDFDENFVTLLPGEKRRLVFDPKENNVWNARFRKSLNVMCMPAHRSAGVNVSSASVGRRGLTEDDAL